MQANRRPRATHAVRQDRKTKKVKIPSAAAINSCEQTAGTKPEKLTDPDTGSNLGIDRLSAFQQIDRRPLRGHSNCLIRTLATTLPSQLVAIVKCLRESLEELLVVE